MPCIARALSPEGDVLDRSIRIRTLPVDQEMVIVGVVGDATQGNPRELHPHLIYGPVLQVPQISAFDPNLLIDTTDPATVAAGVREILREGGRDYAQEVIGLEALLTRAPAGERMSATVAAGVGALAVLLALIGVHAALAYGVSRRRREIGVRVAVGATPTVVARAVVRDGLLIAAAGVALGLPFAWLGARALRSLRYGISEADAMTYIGVAMFFLALGTAAGLLPARQAARVDPVIALRAE